MSRIHQLPASVVAQISAGEVIERPGSVVKELLENAVDAGSRRIDIEVEQGGTDLIRVVDDGSGILADDLPLAFASHATSKLTSADDLFRIGTLGFRGEALASIGGIAQVTLQSRPPDQPSGAEITCHGGQFSPVKAWNGAPGTRVEVRHLFYNTPVRRKFLRATATEMGHVAEVFTRLALSQLGLHLTLRHNGKLVYEVPSSAGLLDRIGLFFGAEVRDHLYPVEGEEGPVTLAGYIADPACERGNSQTQYFFLNSRWVRDRSLGHALQEAYQGLLMTGRYAVAFLYLELPPDQVDVNVHPIKAEVRFRDPQALRQLVLTTIQRRLRAENLTPRYRVPSSQARGKGPSSPAEAELRFDPTPPAVPSSVTTSGLAQPTPPLGSGSAAVLSAPASAPSPSVAPGAARQTLPPSDHGKEGNRRSDSLPPPGVPKAIQLHDMYLVVEVPDGMLLIDQHALHERILFEQLRQRVRDGKLETQRLLIPEPVHLPALQAAQALEHRDALAELGLTVEDFGGGTVLLTTYPAILSKRSPAEILRAVVDYLVTKDRAPSREQLLNDLLSLMACHGAVRSGDRLTSAEVDALVTQRELAQNTHHCPHGRPTSLLFTKHDLDRQFRRI